MAGASIPDGSSDVDAADGAASVAPLSGCSKHLPFGPDDHVPECYVGYRACAQGNAYVCTYDDYDSDSCWQHTPDVSCPLWSEQQCDTALEVFSVEQPCVVDDDCDVWGGLQPDDACNVGTGAPPVGVSNLLSSEERAALASAYDELLSRGCVRDWGMDGTPHVARCLSGRCQAEQHSCFDSWGGPGDGGPDASPDASMSDASTPDVGP